MSLDCLLGKPTIYIENYAPELLFPIKRSLARQKTGLHNSLPFIGIDIWTGYELSWLNKKGKPEIALAEFIFPYHTENVVESKSFKLYLNSLNQTHFESFAKVEQTLQSDLSNAAKGEVSVKLFPLDAFHSYPLDFFSGTCIDTLDIETTTYEREPSFLKADLQNIVEETLYTNLLKSNCLATGQPDWGSVFVSYKGPKIDHEGLLKYFISLRRHCGFAEHCVEQIYFDLWRLCHLNELTVYGRYTRRGGLDINVFRSNFQESPKNIRLVRQ